MDLSDTLVERLNCVPNTSLLNMVDRKRYQFATDVYLTVTVAQPITG